MRRKTTVHRVAWGIGVWGQIAVIVALVVAAVWLTPEPSEKLDIEQKVYKDG